MPQYLRNKLHLVLKQWFPKCAVVHVSTTLKCILPTFRRKMLYPSLQISLWVQKWALLCKQVGSKVVVKPKGSGNGPRQLLGAYPFFLSQVSKGIAIKGAAGYRNPEDYNLNHICRENLNTCINCILTAALNADSLFVQWAYAVLTSPNLNVLI
jgi:hypothetical protein